VADISPLHLIACDVYSLKVHTALVPSAHCGSGDVRARGLGSSLVEYAPSNRAVDTRLKGYEGLLD